MRGSGPRRADRSRDALSMLRLAPGARGRTARTRRWCPRMVQGEGRHDNRRCNGCPLIVRSPGSCIAKQIAAFAASA